MLYLQICSLKPTESRWIEILPNSPEELGFQPESFNRRPNLKFEGSWSRTKMHKTSIHDPHQQIRIQTPQNPSNKPHRKIQRKIAWKRHKNHTSYKREIDATMKVSIQLEVRFFTNQWRKFKPMDQRKWKAVQMDGLPRNPRAFIYEFLWVGWMTKLPLALKLRYKPLRAK
jgi:hypothetical protein